RRRTSSATKRGASRATGSCTAATVQPRTPSRMQSGGTPASWRQRSFAVSSATRRGSGPTNRVASAVTSSTSCSGGRADASSASGARAVRRTSRSTATPSSAPSSARSCCVSIHRAMSPKNFIAISLFIAVAAVAQENPFSRPSALPYQAPPFDKIKDSDFQPAIEEGMKQELVEVEAIANSSAPPTFANTFEAMEKSGQLLRRVQRVFGGLAQSNTNPALQKIQTEMAPKLSRHRDAIVLNPKLFARVRAVYDQRDKLKLDAEQKELVE